MGEAKRTEANKPKKPLVYSCSDCSDVAQIANEVALRLFREDSAEMSCIAGVGDGVPALVKAATSGHEANDILEFIRGTIATQHHCDILDVVNLELSRWQKLRLASVAFGPGKCILYERALYLALFSVWL